MAKIGLIDVDGHSNFPNLALMKIARYHKNCNDEISWYSPWQEYDKVYMSKVFTFTHDFQQTIPNAKEIEKGGTGYSIEKKLPLYIDHLQPLYSIYPQLDDKTAYGFLTRGCVNKCKWCIVPKKEGSVYAYMDVEQIAIENRNKLILMDNNILSIDYGFEQIEKIIINNFSVDFNQGLDARKIDLETAKLLSRVKWLKYIRLACDTSSMIDIVDNAILRLRKSGYKGNIFIYTLLNGNYEECINRVNHFRLNKDLGYVQPHCQPYRDFNSKNQIVPAWQKDIARWCNRAWIFKSCSFEEYKTSKKNVDDNQQTLFF